MKLEECCDGDEILLDNLEDWISNGNGTRHIWIGSRCVAVMTKWYDGIPESYSGQFLEININYFKEIKKDNWFYRDWLGFESEINRLSSIYLGQKQILEDVFCLSKTCVVYTGGNFAGDEGIYIHTTPIFEINKQTKAVF